MSKKKKAAAIRPADDNGAAIAPDPTTRDSSQIIVGDWKRREMPTGFTGGPREHRYQVLIRQSVLNQLHRHGKSVEDIEVCGVLVGNVHHDASGPWLYVEHAIPGNHATQRAAQVTFTAETWEHIQTVMDRDCPDRRILGWYHTHPGFGIFLSDMDVFIQDNFFGEPWQAALVYDPKAKEEGVFLWKEGKPQVDPILIEPDVPAEDATAVVTQAKDVTGMDATTAGGGDVGPLAERLDAIEKRQRLILTLLAGVALLALAWPLAVAAFLPGMTQHKESAPITLPSDDPTSRPMKY